MIFFVLLFIVFVVILFFLRLYAKQNRNKVFEKIKQTSDISGEIKIDFLLNKFKHLVIDENDKKEIGSVISISVNYDIEKNKVVWNVKKEEITELDYLLGNNTKWIEIYKVSDIELDKIIKKDKEC